MLSLSIRNKSLEKLWTIAGLFFVIACGCSNPGQDVDGGEDGDAQDDSYDGHGEGGAEDEGTEADEVSSVCVGCLPNCDGRECGPDGCGWFCGTICEGGMVCTGSGLCARGSAFEVCAGMECGVDPYSLMNCGACPQGWTCSLEHTCENSAQDCTGIPIEGLCSAGYRVGCAGGLPDAGWCAFGLCEVEPATAHAVCSELPCLDGCAGKNCGPDGCGGSCGECGQGERCDEAFGICIPVIGCGGVTEGGKCIGHTRVWCRDEVLEKKDCLAEGLGCLQSGSGEAAECCLIVPGEVPCSGVASSGTCVSGHAFWCENGFLAVDHCAWISSRRCERVARDRYGCWALEQTDPWNWRLD